jgi:hypothetical protein
LTHEGVLASHALRRAYATAATNAGVDENTVGKLLNHGGKSVTAHYIKTSYLGRMLAGAQEDISRHIISALGSPQGGLARRIFRRRVTASVVGGCSRRPHRFPSPGEELGRRASRQEFDGGRPAAFARNSTRSDEQCLLPSEAEVT